MAVRMSRAERREQTRQELISAAEACFVTRGFHATSVDQVAERAGYTKGAVYSNFAAKEDLFFAVYQRRVEHALTEVAPGLRQAGPEPALDWLATGAIERRDRDDGWLAVFIEFWAHVLRHIPSCATASRPSTPASWSRWPTRCDSWPRTVG
jgi:AcrR family transcriptional regulator